MIVKFGGTSVQYAQAIDREHPAIMPAKKQVSGHEFTRAAQPKKSLGFSPCQRKPQGLKANFLGTRPARMKSCPDTCLVIENKTIVLNTTSHLAVLRVSASPRCAFIGASR